MSNNGSRPFELQMPDVLRLRIGAIGAQLPVLFVEGELDLAGVDAVERALAEAVDGGGAVIVDLTACSFIDSTGIAALLRATGGQNGSARTTVAIAGAAGQVGRTLELTDVGRVVPIFPTSEEAARALDGG